MLKTGPEIVSAFVRPGWFLAKCEDCEGGVQPFTDETKRDGWALAHVAATGHYVARARSEL